MKNKKVKLFCVLPDFLLVFCVSSYFFFSLIPKDRAINVDEIRSLLLVQDCLHNHGCHLRASPDTGSVLGISHGALFLHFLTLVHYAGGGITACYTIIVLCAAMAVAVLFSLAKKLHGMAIGMMTALLYMHILFSKGGLALLWNPVLLHLPAALFLYSSICYISSRKLMYFFVSAFCFSLGFQTHLIFLMHLPGFLYLIFLTPRRKRFYTLLAGMGIVGGLTMASSFTIFQNIYLSSPLGGGDPPERNLSFALMAVLVGCMSLPLVYLDWRNGKAVRPVTLFLLIDCYTWWAVLSWLKSPYHRYWYSLFPGLVLLMAESFCFFFSAVVANKKYFNKAINVITILISLHILRTVVSNVVVANPDYETQRKRKFTMGDAKKIANVLSINMGCTYDKAYRHLRGGEHYSLLLHGIGYYLPMPVKSSITRPENNCTEDFAVFKMKVLKADKPPSHEWTILREGSNALAIYRYKPYLKWDTFKACFVDHNALRTTQCIVKEYSFSPRTDHERMASRWPFGMLELAHQSPFTLSIQVPVYVPPHQPDRVIFIPWHKDDVDTCTGLIEEVSGIRYQGKLPSNTITLTGKKYPQSGNIIFSWDFGTPTCSLNAYKWLPPPVLELTQDSFLHISKSGGNLNASFSRVDFGEQKVSQRKESASAFFNEPEKNTVFAREPSHNKIQDNVITVPAWYVIAVMVILIIGATASIIICVLYFRAPGEDGFHP